MKSNILQNIGLNKNEVLIYETLLSSGEMIASVLTDKTKLGRQNTYAVLKSLVTKGLVEEFDKKKKLTYRIEPPQKLLEYTENKKKELEENEKTISSLLPSLMSDYNLAHNKPGISFLEGFDRFKNIYHEILSNKEDIKIIASKHDRDNKLVNLFLDKHITEQAKSGIHVKAIINQADYTLNQSFLDASKENLIENRFTQDNHDLSSQILIFGDKVALTSFKGDVISTVIQNKDTFNTFENLFEMLWDALEENHKKVLKKYNLK